LTEKQDVMKRSKNNEKLYSTDKWNLLAVSIEENEISEDDSTRLTGKVIRESIALAK